MVNEIPNPIKYHTICLIHRFCNSCPSKFLVENIDITLIIKKIIIGMIILFSILNLDMFLIISPRLYSYFTTKQDLFIQKYIYFSYIILKEGI